MRKIKVCSSEPCPLELWTGDAYLLQIAFNCDVYIEITNV